MDESRGASAGDCKSEWNVAITGDWSGEWMIGEVGEESAGAATGVALAATGVALAATVGDDWLSDGDWLSNGLARIGDGLVGSRRGSAERGMVGDATLR